MSPMYSADGLDKVHSDDSVFVFFSYAADDDTSVDNFISEKWAQHLVEAMDDATGDQTVLYNFRTNKNTGMWKEPQIAAIHHSDLFVAFVSPRYVQQMEHKECNDEAIEAMAQSKKGLLDICLIPILEPLKTDSEMWGDLSHFQRWLPLDASDDESVPMDDPTRACKTIKEYLKYQSTQPNHEKAELSLLEDRFVTYAVAQQKWAGDTNRDPTKRPGDASMRYFAARDASLTSTNDLVQCLIARGLSAEDVSEPIRTWKGTLNLRNCDGQLGPRDRTAASLVDLLIMFLERHPADPAVAEWLQSHLPSAPS